MAWLSHNKYMLAGTITAGLTLDNSNPGAGSPIAGDELYGGGLYGSELYQYAAVYEGNYESTYYVNKLTISPVGDSGDIIYSYSLSDDDVTYTSFTTPVNVIGQTSLAMRSKYFKIRFYFKPTLWGDSDSITISNIEAAFTVFQPDTLIYSSEMNSNFQWIAEGSWYPLGGTTLTQTTGVYNLGSSQYQWNNVYANTLVGNPILNRTLNLIGEAIATVAATSLEIAGLNGSVDKTYRIIIFTNNNLDAKSNFGLLVNNISSSSYFIDNAGFFYGALCSLTGSPFTMTSLNIHNPTSDTNTAQYGYCDINFANVSLTGSYHKIRFNAVNWTSNRVSTKIVGAWALPVATFGTITSLKIVAPTTSGLGVGTKIQIWAPR